MSCNHVNTEQNLMRVVRVLVAIHLLIELLPGDVVKLYPSMVEC